MGGASSVPAPKSQKLSPLSNQENPTETPVESVTETSQEIPSLSNQKDPTETPVESVTETSRESLLCKRMLETSPDDEPICFKKPRVEIESLNELLKGVHIEPNFPSQ